MSATTTFYLDGLIAELESSRSAILRTSVYLWKEAPIGGPITGDMYRHAADGYVHMQGAVIALGHAMDSLRAARDSEVLAGRAA